MYAASRAAELSRSGTNMISYEYGLWVKGCYIEARRGPASYTETIYTLLGELILTWLTNERDTYN